jgi:hypothetical protein
MNLTSSKDSPIPNAQESSSFETLASNLTRMVQGEPLILMMMNGCCRLLARAIVCYFRIEGRGGEGKKE